MMTKKPQAAVSSVNPRHTKAAASGRRSGAIGLSRAVTWVAVLIVLVTTSIALLIGSKLIEIEQLASETNSVVIPRTVSQQRRALAIEKLTRFAAQVVHAPTPEVREATLAQAETFAAGLAEGSGGDQRRSIHQAAAAIASAAEDAGRSDELSARISGRLAQGDRIITEIDDNLFSIAEDSASQLDDLIERLGRTGENEIPIIERKLRHLFQVNSASENLLTGVRDGRALLIAAASLDDPDRMAAAAEEFSAITKRMQALLGQLPSTGDYEYLAPLAEDFSTLADIFGLRRETLARQASARQWSESAITNLSLLSENLSNDAAEVAGHSVEEIARSAETIEYTAGGALAFMTLIAVLIGWLGRRTIKPIIAMTATTGKLAAGELAVEIPGGNRPDEIGDMARALEVLRQAAVEKAEMERRQAAEIEAREKRRAEKASKDARIQAEIDQAVSAAVAGDFSQRVDTEGFDGVMLNLGDGMNELLVTVDRGLTETVEIMAALAGGKLDQRMVGDYQGSFLRLKQDANRMAGQIGATVGRIAAAAGSVKCAAEDIHSGAENLSTRAEQQAITLEEMAAAMEEISVTVKTNAESAVAANNLAAATRGQAERGREVVAETVRAMANIRESASEIGNIVATIEAIAFQTNLLALNAAVEAARAGDAGKGFAVVAAEVRTLAQRSGEAAKTIEGLIGKSTEHAEAGNRLVGATDAALTEILEGVQNVARTLEEIADASKEQTVSVDEVSGVVNQMDEVIQQNASMAERSAAAARDLTGQSETLVELVRFFTTGDASGSGAGADTGEDRDRQAWDADARAETEAARKPVPAPPPAVAANGDWAEV